MTAKSIKTIETSIEKYFGEYEVIMTGRFSIERMSKETCCPIGDLEVLLCNMEDTDVMKEIANGDYESFNPCDENLFNDGHYDYAAELGYCEGEDEYEEED